MCPPLKQLVKAMWETIEEFTPAIFEIKNLKCERMIFIYSVQREWEGS